MKATPPGKMHLESSDTPGIIRIKRKRNEDSLQALCIEEAEKKTDGTKTTNKKRKVIFRLKKVDSLKTYAETPVLKTTKENHIFLYENFNKDASQEADSREGKDLQPEINDLLQEFLEQERNKGSSSEQLTDDSDYVYDVYFKEEVNEDEDSFVFDKSTMGYIKIIDDPLVPEEEVDLSDRNALSDDQDSNEEDYYQNDYPEDEDDDRSILFGSDVSDHSSVVHETSYNRDVLVSSSGLINGEYDQLYSKMENSGNFLDNFNSKNTGSPDEYNSDEDFNTYEDYAPNINNEAEEEEEGEVGDYFDEDGEEEFPRNQFFPTDQDDSLAIHRDKIFFKLQKMINKQAKR